MFVMCSSIELNDAQRNELSAMNIGYGGDIISDLDVNRNYLVYAVAIINEVENYLIYDVSLSSEHEEWGWYPSALFKVTDGQKSKYWNEYRFKKTDEKEYCVTYLLAHDSFSKLKDIYLGVCERRSDVVKDFHGMKDKYDMEFQIKESE